MQNNSGLHRDKNHISPKITSTKTTIVKSTPFLIRKHHLDDTQMKQALRYDSESGVKITPRSYSYKGEVRTCMNSKIGDSYRTNKVQSKQSINKQRPSQYYNPIIQNKLQHINNNQKSKFKTCTTGRSQRQQPHQLYKTDQKCNKKQSQRDKQSHKKQNYNVTKIYQNPIFEIKIDSMKSNGLAANDYGLKKTKGTANKAKLQQAQKVRLKYEKKLLDDLTTQSNKVMILEQEIDDLKIRNIQLQKKLLKEFIQQTKEKKDIKGLQKGLKMKISLLIANKPKYRVKHGQTSDTDSSFSSFQLS